MDHVVFIEEALYIVIHQMEDEPHILSQSDKTPSSKHSEGRGYNKLVSVGVTISD